MVSTCDALWYEAVMASSIEEYSADMDWLAAALWVAQGVCRRHMKCIVINIKGIKMTINQRFQSKAVNDQVSLNR